MRSTFSGLELARRALESQQTALDTTGHNIANANSKGYTRQVVNLQATIPSSIPSMGHNLSVGTGVTVQGIERARDIFVDRQYRWENTKQSYWSARQDNLNKVEGLLNEPDDNSFSNDMDKFWNAWSELSKNPENLGSRSVLLERAATLADTLHHIDQQITEMQKGLDSSVRVQINQINVSAKQIQELNFQIKRAEVAGDNPNDLRDKRDTLVDELSQLVNVRVVESRDATFKDREVNVFKVYIGDDKTVNNILVDDTTAYQLEEPTPADATGLPFAEVKWAAGHPYLAENTVNLGDKVGKLQSDLLLRGSGYNLDLDGDTIDDETKDNAYLSYLRQKYNDLAAGIATAVNAIHKTGIDKNGNSGEDFFTSTDIVSPISADNIKVNVNLVSDPWKVATGKVTFDGTVKVGSYGNGEIAQAISSLSSGWTGLMNLTDPGTGLPIVTAPTPSVDASSFGDYYGSSISELGVDVQQATRMAEGQAVLVNHMFNQRESLSGVSLDEEMTNLVRFQKSYSAAARVVTLLDDMLNTIVNGMGITR
ncbi:MAG: flagellar hook-associated protein FlgK [Desulfitobacterium sp.]